jgi:tetratricopeptide (TPR) repeat protein
MTPRRRRRKKPVQPLPRKTSRRWRVPPPILHGPEPLENGAVLEEMPDALGVILWICLRDMMLWVNSPEEDRGKLFRPEAEAQRKEWLKLVEVPSELEEPMEIFAGLLKNTASYPAARLGSASRTVSFWAESEEMMGIALAYAQIRALLDDTNPELSYEVAELARARGEDGRAETWYRHTVMLAREIADWKTYTRAFLALGDQYIARGLYDTAVKLHVRARRAAKRNSLRALQGIALHSLFVIAARRGEHEEAEELAAAAMSTYGPRNRRLALLARDIGYYRLDQGHYSRAIALLESALPHFTQPHERIEIAEKLALAAAGADRSEATSPPTATSEISEHADRLSDRLTSRLIWITERSSRSR